MLDCGVANSCAPSAISTFSNQIFDVFEAWETSPSNARAAAIGRGERIFNTKSFAVDEEPGTNKVAGEDADMAEPM